jgi:hypothetical protein
MKISKRAVLVAGLTAGISGAAWANAPRTGLGQAWPNAADKSVNVNFHAYSFAAGGINYVQINAQNGKVLAAIGRVGGQYFVLPVGQLAQQVSVPEQAAVTAAQPVGPTSRIYDDGTTEVTGMPLSDGTLLIQASPSSLAAPCGDPATCGTKGGA